MAVKDNVDAINEMGAKSYERLNSLNELNMRTWEKLAARQMDAINLLVEQGVRQMKLASESKGVNELVKGEVELAKDVSTRMMEEAKANVELANQVRDAYRDWFQQGVSEVTAEVRKATPSA
jgi:phasin family protein